MLTKHLRSSGVGWRSKMTIGTILFIYLDPKSVQSLKNLIQPSNLIKSDQIWSIYPIKTPESNQIWSNLTHIRSKHQNLIKIRSKRNPAHDLTLEETYLQNVRKIWQNFVVNLMITVWRSRVLWIQVTPRGSQWTLVKVCCSQAAQSAHMQQLPNCTTPPCTTPTLE